MSNSIKQKNHPDGDRILPQFINILRHLRTDLTPDDIADILWLAKYADVDPKTVQDITAQKPKESDCQEPDTQTKTKNAKKTEGCGVYIPDESYGRPEDDALAGIPFRTPTATSLPGRLDLSRSLRPLMRRVPSRVRFEIDEEQTVTRIAETNNWQPALRPVPSRWLDVAIVAEQSDTLSVWHPTIRELKTVLEQQGAFRNVRVWHFSCPKKLDDEIQLQPGFGNGSARKIARRPAELNDPTCQRCILIASDCVSPLWYDGRITRMMSQWGNEAMFAILQMLPFQLWDKTGLGRHESMFFRSTGMGTPNAKLVAESERFRFIDDDEKDDDEKDNKKNKGMFAPVITLEPESLSTYARSLSGTGRLWVPGFRIRETQKPLTFDSPKIDRMPPMKRLEIFRAFASPQAQLLAGCLSVISPLVLPIMFLIQHKMLPKSRQIHLAEVFLSGLLHRVESDMPNSEPEKQIFDFYPEVLQQLRDTILIDETLNVIHAVGEFIETHKGIYRDFTGAIPDPSGVGKKLIPAERKPFGAIKIQLLRGLGGMYAELADELEGKKPPYPRRRHPIEVSEEEFKKVFELNDDWKPLKYVPNQYEPKTIHGEKIVVDRATGLMWQQSGSDDYMKSEDAEKYIQELNRKRFAGYTDWRLPTVDELTSLLEPEEISGDLYIDPVFDKKQLWCWSSDKCTPGSAWLVSFSTGYVDWFHHSDQNYVRAVRSR